MMSVPSRKLLPRPSTVIMIAKQKSIFLNLRLCFMTLVLKVISSQPQGSAGEALKASQTIFLFIHFLKIFVVLQFY